MGHVFSAVPPQRVDMLNLPYRRLQFVDYLGQGDNEYAVI